MNSKIHRWLAGAWASATLVVALLLIQVISIQTTSASPAAQGPAKPSDCIVNVQHDAFPPVLLIGEDVSIQLNVRATCSVSAPLHIVLVVDASAALAGTLEGEKERAIKGFIEKLDMPNKPSIRVGVVQFKTAGRTICQLTNDEGRAKSCVNKMGSSGGRRINAGIEEGLEVLRKGRTMPGDQHINEVMIVIAAGPDRY
jgi:hypothetical protein